VRGLSLSRWAFVIPAWAFLLLVWASEIAVVAGG
jgi:hypothetical protein